MDIENMLAGLLILNGVQVVMLGILGSGIDSIERRTRRMEED